MPASDQPLVLGIESSCDETAAAVVAGMQVLGAAVATQHELHEEYGGVVPEIASRAHLERILPVIRAALAEADVKLEDVDAVAVGHRPGLIGALLVGTSAAKALALGLGVPFLGVDHVHAHLVSGLMRSESSTDAETPSLPALGLVLSGGHTSLYRIETLTRPILLGRTIDDAIGEAFDKVASMLGLGHPGGPAVERLAAEGDAEAFGFPIANLGRHRLDFSYSGLKTSVRYTIHGIPGREDAHPGAAPADVAASFQSAAIAAVRRNLRKAIAAHPDTRALLVGGGVIANRSVRAMLEEECRRAGLALHLPGTAWSQDNGAMIAALGGLRLAEGGSDDLDLAPAATTRDDRVTQQPPAS
ncbi:MAG: tRNA (adenosine(37)-N6)-threonylcarbamoyltransferase complex transferase subunit TsaD [Phycisphaerae bacterium]|nr:tRNA (adenosine(37)-N6)-threonylcarbamoyltransferase complex transferase subunit TsaD [Phycisphaerae bacterium]